MKAALSLLTCVCTALVVTSATGLAQTPAQPADRSTSGAGAEASGVTPPPGYVIGADDRLAIRFWDDERLSAEGVVVRSDGMISLPLLNDIQAAGLTPEQFKARLEEATAKLYKDPLTATVIVNEIRSRKVYVIGDGIARSGVVPLNSDKNVLMVLSESGGLLEYADKNGIFVIRNEGGKEVHYPFRYNDVIRGRNSQQNIMLEPGDTIVVP